MIHKNTIFFSLFIFALAACKKQAPAELPIAPDDFIRGADLSFLPEIEAANYTFYNRDSIAQNALNIFKDAGCNTVRIRIWKNPSTAHSSFEEVKNLSERVHNLGMNVWLTVHYSDWWADPANQTKPAAWANLPFENLKDSVYAYTKMLVRELHPDIIQIGNEINNGFLWPDGAYSNPTQFHQLLKSGISAVREENTHTKIMIHFAGPNTAKWFFTQIDSLDYDQIGLSFYPKWHGKDLIELESNLEEIGQLFNKEVILAETAYPFTFGWNDWTNNIVGDTSATIAQFPASPEGQKAFLNYLKLLMQKVKNGQGFCYWAPDWVAFKGAQATDASSWENQALFNFNGRALPALEVYNR